MNKDKGVMITINNNRQTWRTDKNFESVMLTLVSNILFQKWSSSFDFCWTSWRNNKLDVPYLHLFTEKCWCSLCNESHFSQGLFYLVENVLWNQTCRKLTYIHTCITFISVSSRSSTKALIGDTQTHIVCYKFDKKY